MTCDGCVKDISTSLYKLDGMAPNHAIFHSSVRAFPNSIYCAGINKVDADLKDQLVFIEGTAPPSSIVSAIQDTGRDAILRGSGTTNSMSWPSGLPLSYDTI